ncbi:TrbI F-type domain-containing protein, partial [Klebsiella aerogenes]
LKMPAFEWVHVQLHQQKGMISLSPPTICNSASLDDWQQKNHVLILVSPAVVNGAPDVTLSIQRDIAKRMQEGRE